MGLFYVHRPDPIVDSIEYSIGVRDYFVYCDLPLPSFCTVSEITNIIIASEFKDIAS